MLPQRVDGRTLRIVVPKSVGINFVVGLGSDRSALFFYTRPTMEARQSVATVASRQAEDAKVKIRASRESGMKELKRMGYAKNSKFADEVRIRYLLLENYLTSVLETDAKGHRQPYQRNRRCSGQTQESSHVLNAGR